MADPREITLQSPVGIDVRCESCKTIIAQPLSSSTSEGVSLFELVRTSLRHACQN